MIKATLIGGSGYIGGEVLRLLLGHPEVDLHCVTAGENAGKRVDELQPNLRGFTDLVFEKDAKPADVTFMALPHGQAEKHVPKEGKVIDLSGDHRIGKGWTTGIPEISDVSKTDKVPRFPAPCWM